MTRPLSQIFGLAIFRPIHAQLMRMLRLETGWAERDITHAKGCNAILRTPCKNTSSLKSYNAAASNPMRSNIPNANYGLM